MSKHTITDPVNSFKTVAELKEFLNSVLKTPLEDKVVKEYFDRYGKMDIPVRLVVNKAESVQNDTEKTNMKGDYILLGARDFTYTKDVTLDTGKIIKVLKPPFQSFVTALDPKTKKFEQFAIKGSPKLAQKGIEWGKLGTIGIEEETNQKGYSNKYVKKSENNRDVNLEDILKSIYILPEYITKEMADAYSTVCLYGEIVKVSLESDRGGYNEDGSEREEETYQPFYEVAKSKDIIPCLKFTIRCPNEEIADENKIVTVHYRPQILGRTVLKINGFNESLQKMFNTMELEDIESELNSLFGGSKIKVFVIGWLSGYNPNKEGVIFANLNATYGFETNYIPTTYPTFNEVETRISGSSSDSAIKEQREKLINDLKTKGFDMLGIDAPYEKLKELGIFDSVKNDLGEDTIKKFVEKEREKIKSGVKKESKPSDESKSNEEPKKVEEKITLTAEEIAQFEPLEKEVLGMDVKPEELMKLIKSSIREKYGAEKFVLWKKTRIDVFLDKIAKQEEAKKSSSTLPVESKPVEDVKSEESKPVESKPVESKPVEEIKTEESKPVESKPVEDVKSENVKSEDSKPVEEIKTEESKQKTDLNDPKLIELRGNLKDLSAEIQTIGEYIYLNGGKPSEKGIKKSKILKAFEPKYGLDKIKECIASLIEMEIINEIGKDLYSVNME